MYKRQPQFNINNLEWTKAVLTACEEMKSPVILGVSEGAGKYMTGFKTVAAMVLSLIHIWMARSMRPPLKMRISSSTTLSAANRSSAST